MTRKVLGDHSIHISRGAGLIPTDDYICDKNKSSSLVKCLGLSSKRASPHLFQLFVVLLAYDKDYFYSALTTLRSLSPISCGYCPLLTHPIMAVQSPLTDSAIISRIAWLSCCLDVETRSAKEPCPVSSIQLKLQLQHYERSSQSSVIRFTRYGCLLYGELSDVYEGQGNH